ncbi:MAG: c-type cytochrome [Candidatus Promineifilaceae bacterium]|nr:c-type cytochrome [Candidatus Promineifilaceae bacterium]
MVAGRLKPASQEWAARLLVLALVAGLLLTLAATRRTPRNVVVLRATMPESGGWQPGHLTAAVGQPLHVHLVSDDVIHGFAVGPGPDGLLSDNPTVDVEPGKVTELTLSFDRPGTYTYFCTRWCGPNHWRMRGTIEVTDGQGQTSLAPSQPPLYIQLGLDIDAPRPAPVAPERTPSAWRGIALDLNFPKELLDSSTYMTESPLEVWLALGRQTELAHLDAAERWDAVAAIWRQKATDRSLVLGQTLYSQNCAACHGASGAGDGVFSESNPGNTATNFRDPALLATSNAVLEGKILRGGMGTGMPAWGPIFTQEDLRALLDYLWTFQFPVEADTSQR